MENYTSVIDLIFEMSGYLVFHQSWEIRHGALLIYRSISRVMDSFFTFQEFINQKIVQINQSFSPILLN